MSPWQNRLADFRALASRAHPRGYVVRDANGQALACVYSGRTSRGAAGEDSDQRRSRRIAVNIARLPELLGKAEPE